MKANESKNNINMKSFSSMSAAFWLCLAPVIVPFFIDATPCAFCLIARSLFATAALACFISKWTFKSLRKLAIALLAVFELLGIYHLLIIFNIMKAPRICTLNSGFFGKTLSQCSASDPYMIIGAMVFAAIIIGLISYAVYVDKKK